LRGATHRCNTDGVSVHFKICGITCVEDADLALAAGASAIGLNLVPASPRAIDVETARRIAAYVGQRAISVLVVADRSADEMSELLATTGAACLQMHGDEAPHLVARFLPHAYKAVRIGAAVDVERARDYPGEYLLVDAKVPGKLGGSGMRVDWTLVEPLARERRLTLAGGLDPANVGAAIAEVRPFCVDVASGVEKDGNPRRKDEAKVSAFARAVADAALRLA
jgi:phosphoribosylanthranilate isomerase